MPHLKQVMILGIILIVLLFITMLALIYLPENEPAAPNESTALLNVNVKRDS